jgi:hypothetical protein
VVPLTYPELFTLITTPLRQCATFSCDFLSLYLYLLLLFSSVSRIEDREVPRHSAAIFGLMAIIHGWKLVLFCSVLFCSVFVLGMEFSIPHVYRCTLMHGTTLA